MKNRPVLRLWFGYFLTMATITAVCICWIDYPVAAMLLNSSKQGSVLGELLSGRHIMAVEILVIIALWFAHYWNDGLPKWGKTLLVACTASIIAYWLNDMILKIIFGRSNPANFYQLHTEKFALFNGSDISSFPSGHMMLSAAFLAVAVSAYSRIRIATVLLLFIGCVVLVLGDWHFVSDVLVGTLFGFIVGLATAELWTEDTIGEV